MAGHQSPEPVVIIVVPRDRFSMFPRCLEALYARTEDPFRVIVVAGAIDGASREYLDRLQTRTRNLSVLLPDHLVLQAEARNLALAQCDERYVVVLENDTIVHDGWLHPLRECMRDEGAAVVTPLLWWYRGLHAAGGTFHERADGGTTAFMHAINYTGICRRRIDYPENHCLLIDRRQLSGDAIFDEVEPFDVDLGLTLRKRGLGVFLEPRSTATYSAPPPIELRDVPPFALRWDWKAWEARNQRFVRKWSLSYDLSAKRASYRRQRVKLGLAGWNPTRTTVGVANFAFGVTNRILTFVTRRRLRRSEAAVPHRPHATE